MKGAGPREERETIIRFDEDGPTASIWTASETVYRRLKKRGFMPTEDGERHAVFEVGKKAIWLPRQQKPMPEAQREALRATIAAKLKGSRAKKELD